MSNKSPEIRFNGFTDDWEQRKLEEVAQITMGQSPNGENYTDNQNDHILVQGNADMKNGKVVPRVWTTQVTKIAMPNDIILSVRAPVGDVGKTDYSVVLGRGVAGIKGNEFIYQTLLRLKRAGFWAKYTTGSTFESINSKDLKKALIYIPSENEQFQIGEFLKKIDNTIALHQRELENLKESKKGFLQKMFPKNVENLPEIRFSEYTQEWEEISLESCFTERNERSAEGELISVTINSGVVKANTLDRKDNSSIDKKNYKRVEVNDIAYNSMRMWQGASGISLYSGILSPAYTVIIPKENINSQFFSYQFKTINMIHTFQANSQGLTSDTWNLKFPLLKRIKVKVPVHAEQIKIGNFLRTLDAAIERYQDKLEILKQTKKAFLQKMFV